MPAACRLDKENRQRWRERIYKLLEAGETPDSILDLMHMLGIDKRYARNQVNYVVRSAFKHLIKNI